MADKKNITYRVLIETELKLLALARIAYRKPGATIDMLVADAWESAKAAGLVNDDLLLNATVTALPHLGVQAGAVVLVSADQAEQSRAA